MKFSAVPLWMLAISAVLALSASQPGALAQETSAVAFPTNLPTSEVEQLRAINIRLQAQLREAELAIERNRAEAQEAARLQAAAITEKLSAIQAALDAERKRQQDELDKQRDALQKSNRTILWVACGFGLCGFLAMVYTALFQWRTTTRLAEVSARALLPAPADASVVVDGQAGMQSKVVELSNQRLMAVIEKLERRVFELEHTTTHPATGEPMEAGRALPAPEPDTPAARIMTLLGRGQSLLNADKPEEALACYDEILTIDANHPEALVKKGAALERLKKDDEALTCYDRAIAADGTLTIAYLYKGGVFNRLERYNEALECYEQALRVQGGAS